MWKKTIGAGFLALMCGTLLVGCSGGKTFRVKGTIEGAKNGTLYLQYEQDGRYVSVDSLEMGRDGSFDLTGDASEPRMYYLAFGETAPVLSFFAEGAPVTVRAHIDSLDCAQITGGEGQALYNEFMDYMREFAARKETAYLNILRASTQDGPKDSLEAYTAAYEQLDRRQLQYVANFVATHPDSPLSPLLAYTFLNKGYSPLLDTLQAKFTPEVAASLYGKEFSHFVTQAKNTLVGMSVPEFELRSDSVSFHREDFAGKTLFLVAWTAGDPVNIDYMSALKEVYEQWHPKGLEVLSSCIGGSDQEYGYDIYSLSLPWNEVRDARGVKNELVDKFALTGTLPSEVLIGEDGTILARGISPEALEEVLEYLSQQQK